MRALLDTSVLLLPPERLKAATVGYGELAISVATVGEVEHGLLGAGTDWALRFQRDLAHRNMLRLFKVLPFDRAAAREYAKVCFLVRQRGRTPPGRRSDDRRHSQCASGAAAHGERGGPARRRGARRDRLHRHGVTVRGDTPSRGTHYQLPIIMIIRRDEIALGGVDDGTRLLLRHRHR